jgi:hypothetical protein
MLGDKAYDSAELREDNWTSEEFSWSFQIAGSHSASTSGSNKLRSRIESAFINRLRTSRACNPLRQAASALPLSASLRLLYGSKLARLFGFSESRGINIFRDRPGEVLWPMSPVGAEFLVLVLIAIGPPSLFAVTASLPLYTLISTNHLSLQPGVVAPCLATHRVLPSKAVLIPSAARWDPLLPNTGAAEFIEFPFERVWSVKHRDTQHRS